MGKAVWNQRELERLYQHYCDETAIHDFQPAVISAWAETRGYEMPTPPTPREILTRLLSHAALAARRKDRKTKLSYRAALVCRKLVRGEWRNLWFDADGPAATAQKVLESYNRRKDKALDILVSGAATLEHWFSEHPRQVRPENLDLGISEEEVRWRLLGKADGEDEQQKAG